MFNVLINYLCDAISYSRYLLSADGIKTCSAIKSPK
jgi:hypothetical protein